MRVFAFFFFWLFPVWVYAQETPASLPSTPPKGDLVLTQEAPQPVSSSPGSLVPRLFLASKLFATTGFVIGVCSLGAALETQSLERQRVNSFDNVTTEDVQKSITLTKTLGVIADVSLGLAAVSFGTGLYLKNRPNTQLAVGPTSLSLSVRF